MILPADAMARRLDEGMRGSTPAQLESFPVGSAEWWLGRLTKRLAARRPLLELYEAYYDGEHRLQFATSKFRETFGGLFAQFADNWCDLIVDASVERLAVEGFRFGGAATGDDAAWAIWQANGLDAASVLAHTEACKCGEAYLLVEPGDDTPTISVESPLEVAVEKARGARRAAPAAAVKRWPDIDGHDVAVVYLPDEVVWFRTEKVVKASATATRVRWERFDADERPAGVVENELGVVPIVPILNRPRLRSVAGVSDLKCALPVQDAVNKLVADMLVASEYAAFRQRWATGIEIPRDEFGNPRTGDFLSSVSRMWTAENPDIKFGEFSASDLGNYVKGFEALIQHLAAQTRTPPHYLLGQSGAFPSGESLKATETGLVAKVRRKMLSFGESWEDAMRLAFRVEGDAEHAGDMQAETIWRDPESRTEGERVDALVKMGTLGVPREALWERWGASQAEIQRWKAAELEENIRSGLFAGAPTDNGAIPDPAAEALPVVEA